MEKVKNIDVIIVDNNPSFSSGLPPFFKSKNLSADIYTNPEDFLDNLYKYSKNTMIIIDSDYGLKYDMNGFDLAKILDELGYIKLYIMSGKNFDQADVPPYLTAVHKDINSFMNLLKTI
jgi:FixJ family two-component response regulator